MVRIAAPKQVTTAWPQPNRHQNPPVMPPSMPWFRYSWVGMFERFVSWDRRYGRRSPGIAATGATPERRAAVSCRTVSCRTTDPDPRSAGIRPRGPASAKVRPLVTCSRRERPSRTRRRGGPPRVMPPGSRADRKTKADGVQELWSNELCCPSWKPAFPSRANRNPARAAVPPGQNRVFRYNPPPNSWPPPPLVA